MARLAELRQRRAQRASLLVVVLALAGCSAVDTADYYWQGASGQLEILSRARPIPEVIGESSDPALKSQLLRVQEIRAFASRELALPDNGSYTRYADLGRPYVVWNVFASPELSLTTRRWCFPIAGCVSYRGYFNERDARDEAGRLESGGEDVWVSGVPAYSTLGYFDDPVLSTFVRWPEVEVARMVFHELAHQVVYVKDDTQFNESFAVTVEEAGVARWLAARRDPQLESQYARNERLRATFRDLVQTTRARLTELYASTASDDEKRARKRQLFAAMREGYERAKAGEPGLAGYDRWFATGSGPNNASIASIALYTGHVPAFRSLLAAEHGDLTRFYARVRELAALPKDQRDVTLARAAAGGVPVASAPGTSP